jgi:hypothetical protein
VALMIAGLGVSSVPLSIGVTVGLFGLLALIWGVGSWLPERPLALGRPARLALDQRSNVPLAAAQHPAAQPGCGRRAVACGPCRG